MQQIALARWAGEIEAGPKIVFVDPHSEALIMDFIPGRVVHPRDFQTPYYLDTFAEALRSLHQSSINFPIASSPFKRFHNFLDKNAYPSLLRIPEIKALMKDIENVFQVHESPLVPSHLDLHSHNIMLSGERFFLVDWVNGGMSNPYFDLATFAIFHGLSESQIKNFLGTYFGRNCHELEWNLFVVAQPVRLFVIAAAYLSLPLEKRGCDQETEGIEFEHFIHLGAVEKRNVSHRQIGFMMLKAALQLIDGTRFKESLASLKRE